MSRWMLSKTRPDSTTNEVMRDGDGIKDGVVEASKQSRSTLLKEK